VLLVLTKSRILQALCARRGQTQRLIEFSIRQQPGVGGDLASQEFQLQRTVEIDRKSPFWQSPIGFPYQNGTI